MEITYIYHSCFLVKSKRFNMIFDFFADPVATKGLFKIKEGFSKANKGIGKESAWLLSHVDSNKPLYVVISHHHKDHYTPEVFGWWEDHPDIRYILSKEVARFARHHIKADSTYKGVKAPEERVIILRAGEEYHDENIMIEAFGSTDCGCSWLVTPIASNGKPEGKEKSLFHAGDLNAWIWIEESTKAEVEAAIRDFNKVLDSIAEKTDRIGYCMFPVDSRIGTHWYMGAEIMTRRFKIDHFFPMHFILSDTPEEKMKRMADACRFDLYANPKYGEYIALTMPHTSFRDAH